MSRNEYEIANTFNEHYIDIVEKSIDHKPVNIESQKDSGKLIVKTF